MPQSSRYEIPTSDRGDWPLESVVAAKGGHRISVVLPALDEAETVGTIVRSIRELLIDVPEPLVDDVVVLDSGSTDTTATVAAAAGARVVTREDALPAVSVHPGKGEAMWRSLFATQGDIVVFIDADLVDFDPHSVAALVGPLLNDDGIDLVKAYYDRPLHGADGAVAGGGGRVTELVARPLLNLHWPALSGLVQPLVGEYAARRSLLESIPFACGYGVELGMLIDTLHLRGAEALAQVDLGERRHDHQDLRALGRMAAELWQVAIDRLDRDGRIVLVQEPVTTMTQFAGSSIDGAPSPQEHDVALRQRPPAKTVDGYATTRVAYSSEPEVTAAPRA
jgi:glucosyl-3-phosphoglycerate synthase